MRSQRLQRRRCIAFPLPSKRTLVMRKERD